MFKAQACLFDLDGVLVDTAKFHFLAWKKIADELGIAFSELDNEELKGISRIESLQRILNKGGQTLTKEHFDALLTKKNLDYLSFVNSMTLKDVLPGVVTFLAKLKAEGVLLALGSASKNAPLILERCELTVFFDAIIDGNSCQISKPAPDVFLMGAKALGVSPESCIVFEDAHAGIEAAHAAGCKTVGVGDLEMLHNALLVIPNFIGVTWQTLLANISLKIDQ